MIVFFCTRYQLMNAYEIDQLKLQIKLALAEKSL